MVKVLRGGKWGRVQSRSTAPSGQAVNSYSGNADEDQRESATDTILSLTEEGKFIGVACFEAASNEIHVSRISSCSGYGYVQRLVSSLDSSYIVLPLSYKDHEQLIYSLRPAKGIVDQDEEEGEGVQEAHDSPQIPNESDSDEGGEISINFLPNQEFGLRKASELCSLIHVLGMPRDAGPNQRLGFLSHILGNGGCVLRAAGGLISFILQRGILGSSLHEDNRVQINAVRQRNFINVMGISPITLRALHVFKNDLHPVGRGGGMRGKEGLSIYGIFKSHIKTATGRKLLKEWLHFPLTDVETIRQRQSIVQSMSASNNHAFLATLKDALRGIRNVSNVLARLRRVAGDMSDWKTLFSSSKSFVMVLETLKAAVRQDSRLMDSNLVNAATEINEDHLRDTVSWIEAVVDFEEGTIQGRMVVAPGFSAEIDEQKRTYSGLDDFLVRVGVEEHKKLLEQEVSSTIASIDLIFEPQIGYLVATSAEEVDRIGLSQLSDVGLNFMFSSAGQSFFKSERCKELDIEPGDLHGAICDLEAKAFRYLEGKIFDFEEALYKMSIIVTELDCLHALASAAIENSWAMPTFSDDDTSVEIVEGRHPLLELTVPSYIPNNTKLKSGDVQVVTGPNYSGKSAYLAQIALISVLAQVGSCVPAKQAQLIIFTNINCRVTNFDSLTSRQSSFFSDASQVSAMLIQTEGRALNLIDEFGKGTAEVSGMSLLASTLGHLLGLDETRVVTLCATHFYEILREPFLPLSNPRLRVFSMEVLTRPTRQTIQSERGSLRSRPSNPRRSSETPNDTTAEGEERVLSSASGAVDPFGNVVRTYRLLPGSICEQARAIQCALEAGVVKRVLERAAHIRSAMVDGKVENSVPAPAGNARMMNFARFFRAFLSSDADNEAI